MGVKVGGSIPCLTDIQAFKLMECGRSIVQGVFHYVDIVTTQTLI